MGEDMTQTIGFIGLGNMGKPMAEQIAGSGRPVLVFDRDPARAAAVSGANVQIADVIEQVAQVCDMILLSLPTPAVAQAVVRELLDDATPDLLIVDFSTNDPQTSRELGAMATQCRASYIDAPLSGGPSRAATAQLTTMVGGDVAAVKRAWPVLQRVATEVIHVGPPGSGSVAKLLNNFVAIWNMIGVSQAFLAASALQIPLENLYQVMSKSSGRSYSLDRNYPKIRDWDFTANFSAELAEKDFRLALDMFRDAGLPAVAEEQLMALFKTAARKHGQQDVAAIHQLLPEFGGTPASGSHGAETTS